MSRFANIFEAAMNTLKTYYTAFSQADIDRLMALWINEPFTHYIREDGILLHGADNIRQYYIKHFANNNLVNIEPLETQIYDSIGTTVYSVLEAHTQAHQPLEATFVFATYVLIHEQGKWLIAHIHSSTLSSKEQNYQQILHQRAMH